MAHRSHYHHAPAHYRPVFCHYHPRPHFGCRYVRHISWPAPLVIYVASVPYFYDRGVFYIERRADYYETVVPPIGAIVPEIPDDYTIVVIDGYEYYQVDRTLYKFIDYNGQPAFEVVGQLN